MKRDMQAFRMRKRIPRQHLEDRRVGKVDQRHVAEEAIGVEDVEEVLAGGIERGIRHNKVDVEVQIAQIQVAAARQHEIDAIVELLVAAVGAAVIVDHLESALVDVLGGEEEAVIVRPQRALELAEVARHIDQPPLPSGPEARVSVAPVLILSRRASVVLQR